MDVFTSITLNYLPKARILASCIKKVHPTWIFHVCISDRLPIGNILSPISSCDEPFDKVVWIEELKIEGLYGWLFKHTIVEICTAVKGLYAWELLSLGSDKVLYLDPDIAVFNNLEEIEHLLDKHPILLTPHQLDIEDTLESVMDNEICSLQHGVFNLGFFAVNNNPEGKRFIQWYRQRLLDFCYDDIPNGLFTDQKWCDLAPAFFEGLYILHDPGYNVASWNLSKREVTCNNDGVILVNGTPLRFYHFTGYDSGAGTVMTLKYAKGNHVVHELWAWYRLQLIKFGQDSAQQLKWHFDFYENGEQIPRMARVLYRTRKDLQVAFPSPFAIGQDGGYEAWYRHNR